MRPIVDEVINESIPPTIVLEHLDDDLLHASSSQRLTTLEIKHVARRVLEALSVLHEHAFVHTGGLRSLQRFRCS